MVLKNEVLLLARKAMKHFGLQCEVKFLSYRLFKQVAMKSPLIRQVLDEGASFAELKIPALIYHKGHDSIYFCEDILVKLVKHLDGGLKKVFIESVIYHEIFHVLYEHEVQQKNFVECLKSEDRVCHSFKKKYPALYKVGYDLHKKATNI
ncbi:MAG: hypothetical protein Q7R96_00600 [Nanoarchaeota archaeon]|nr:hypothetical protein [Nanoarchaeota archaeon]